MKQWTITWHKASEELPQKSGEYLVAQISKYNGEVLLVITSNYSTRHKAFNARDEHDTAENATFYPFWAEYPKKLEKTNEVTV